MSQRGKNKKAFRFGTKAETLEALAPLSRGFAIAPLFYFSVEKWREDQAGIIDHIRLNFQNKPVIVRSSSLFEDGADSSQAGAFLSVPNVDSNAPDSLARAVEDVIASYPGPNPLDQVLVQAMVEDVAVSGVIMTHCLDDGSPYYVLNYDDESGRIDSITAGKGVNKTVFIHRGCRPGHFDSDRVRQMMALAREVEDICGPAPLDLEFITSAQGRMHLLQARPISTAGQWHVDVEKRITACLGPIAGFVAQRQAPRQGVWGQTTLLGNMPDWNPAELIGVAPRPLAASLFREIITRRVWSRAREQMGYRPMPDEELMVLVGGRPYIDVRNSFNSFLPAGTGEQAGARLVDAWLERLCRKPELHDKVEFEVACTIHDFSFSRVFDERYPGVLQKKERQTFQQNLLALTNRCLDTSPRGSLAQAWRSIESLEKSNREEPGAPWEGQNPMQVMARVKNLLEDCKYRGTLPFSVIARHGFIAESFLRSAVFLGAVEEDRVRSFKRSVQTVMGRLKQDLLEACKDQARQNRFLETYGHLRPGTYDIRSLRYADREDLFNDCVLSEDSGEARPFQLTDKETRAVDRLLAENQVTALDAAGLFEYAARAIQGREYAKFVFTRNLSNALEGVAAWGERLDLGRDDLSHLSIQELYSTLVRPVLSGTGSHFSQIVEQQRERARLARSIRLGYLIRGERDLYVVPMHRAAPNFITAKTVEGPVARLDSSRLPHPRLYSKIVCIENADPGFDWIFTRGIAGLVTKFGGANSHMAIRCAEMGLPAAIGCGEQLFEKVVRAGKVRISGAENTVTTTGIRYGEPH